MALVTSDILRFTLAGLRIDFQQAYMDALVDADWKNIATPIDTTMPTQDYSFLGRSAVMERYTGRDTEQTVNQRGVYSISDAIFRANLTIDRKSIEDDQYGAVQMSIRQLGGEAARHVNELVFTTLVAGFTNPCYDGQNFFDTDHQEGLSPVQSNTFSQPLSDAALETVTVRMKSYKDDKNKPLQVVPNTLIVGPANERRAMDLVGSDVVVVRIGEGTAGTGATAATPFSNFFKGKMRMVIVTPYIDGNNAYNWFVADASRAVRPIIVQNRSDVPTQVMSDMTDQGAMMKEQYSVVVRKRQEAGYGLWQTCHGSNASS